MNAQDELAEVIGNFRDDWYKVKRMAPAGIDRDEAKAILAAGYSKPRTITTVEELDALPGESVVRDASGMVYELDFIVKEPANKWWITPGSERHSGNRSIDLPALVLWVPEP